MTARGVAGPSADGLPVPRYGERSLSDVLPSVLGMLGVPGEPRTIALPEARRVCVLLVDALGLAPLRRDAGGAPFLASLLPGLTELTAGFPATTVTSLTSLGSGLPPGRHGMTGYEMFLPEIGRPLNGLRWDQAVDPRVLLSAPTAFERAARAGVAVTRVSPRAFEGKGLTEVGLRGGSYAGADSAGERVAAAAEALRSGDRSLVYVYYGDLDLTGHIRGCSSPAWQFELARVDQFAQQLAGVLPDDGLLLVTADHGMVDVPMDGRIDVAETPILDQGVRLITGEPRATYVHVVDGAREDVASAWRETLGRRAWVLTRDQAVAAGWYGDRVADHVLPRIGDLVVAMRDDSAVVDSRRMRPTLLSLVGMHGSLTDDELLVPLLVAGPG